jgi:hypothetical protein
MASSNSNKNDEMESGASWENEPRSPDAELAALVARDLQQYLVEQVGSLGGFAEAWFASAGTSGGVVSKGKTEIVNLCAEAERYVRQNPVKSLAGSFAVGAIIGILSNKNK